MRSDPISNVDLSSNHYIVKQSLVRNKYQVETPDGQLVLKAKQKLFKMKEEFPFVDPNGNEIFTVKAGGILDIAGDYTLYDSQTDEPVVILDKNFSFFIHKWQIRDPDTENVLATIESRSALLEAARNFSFLASLVPHKYDIELNNGTKIGEIEGQFSMRDVYDLRVNNSPQNVPREAIVASAIAIDALEGN